jgi:NTE family protein
MAASIPSDRPARRVAIACQGGGSHTAFTAGVLGRMLGAEETRNVDIVGISGTSGGAVCAFLAWYTIVDKDPAAAGPLLEKFWAANSSEGPLQSLLNSWVMWVSSLQGEGLMPVISPYHSPVSTMAANQFRDLLRKQVDMDRITVDSGAQHPMLLLGAVDVLSGEFRSFNSRSDLITADSVLASAAIPNLFRSVHVDGGTYWDGLFSQNPPVGQLLDVEPDELWVIQINPKERDTEPTTVVDIADRRNELAGNLSLFQELTLIEKIDGMLESGMMLTGGKYKQVVVRIIELSRSSLPGALGSTSKLNRDPKFLRSLIAHGRAQAEEFLAGLSFESVLAGQDLEQILGCFSPDAELLVEAPFSKPGTHQGADALRTFWAGQLATGFQVDTTRKQVARERITWSVRLRRDEGTILGRAAATFAGGKVVRLALGPATTA